MGNKRIPIESDKFYHIYNHSVGKEVLFRVDDNYKYFLTKIKESICSIADIYAYCLMPNHFHLLIKMNNEEALIDFYKNRNSSFSDQFKLNKKIDPEDMNKQNS